MNSMRTKMSTALFLSVSILGFSDLARAQENTGLDEIIVTAQKREQSLQDVPMAVSTIPAEQLEKSGVFRPTDLAVIVPNLNVTTPHVSGAPNFSMRGISVANEYGYNQASPIGIYVDEVYLASRFMHGANLYDMERVEALRGPQGTLYGRNTTGGAINFLTKKPELGEDLSGFVTAGFGNRDRKTLEGALNLGLSENLALRVAGKFEEVDDFMENVNPNGEDGQGGKSVAGRASMRYSNESVDVTLRAYTSNEDSGGTGVISLGSGPNGANQLSGINPRMHPDTGQPLTDRQFNSSRTEDVKLDADGINLTAKIGLGDNLELTSITSWDQGSIDQPMFDWSASPVAMGWGDWFTENEQLQQDLRLSWNYDRGNIIIGAYYGWDETIADNKFHFYEELAPLDLFVGLGVVPIVVNHYYEQERKSLAFYGHGSFEVNDKLTLTLGLRHTDDDFEYNNAQAYLTYNVPAMVVDLDGDAPGSAGPGSVVSTVTDPDAVNADGVHFLAGLPNFIIPTVPSGPLGALNGRFPDMVGSTSKVTGTAIIDYEVAQDVKLYGSFSRGYRAGTITGNGYLDESQIKFVDPEIVDAWEVGVKSRFADNRIQLNAAAFLYDYTDHQLTNIVGIVGFLENASGAEIKGFEAEMAALATDDLQVNLNIGYQDATYKDLQLQAGANLVDLSGNQMMNAPKWNISAGLDWDIFHHEKGTLNFSPTASYTSHQYLSPFNELAGNERLQQDAYWLVNAQLAWEAENYTARLWTRNLTDKTYFVYGIDIRSGFDVDYFVRGEPRAYGADITFRF